MFRRLQYPLIESSEPIFDLERLDASSHRSGSTRMSDSTFRRAPGDERNNWARDEIDEDSVDIVVVEKKLPESSTTRMDELGSTTDRHPNGHGSDPGSTRFGFDRKSRGVFLTDTVWPFLKHFFSLSFQDPEKERHYVREAWFLSKRTAIYTSLYYYLAWALVLGLYPRPWHPYDYYFYLGILGLFVIPLLPLIILDVPTRFPMSWNIFLFFTTWLWSFSQSLQLKLCGYYTATPNCGHKDFIGVCFYLVAMPTMSLFTLRMNRFTSFTGTTMMLIFIAVAIIPEERTWIRNLFNFLVFQLFILYISYAREKSDRKIFSLRDQLKHQYKATQKAQVAESRASDSKKRFVNYIFHEVRVPLNTALLSVQNLVGEEVFKDVGEEHVELVDVLQGSLGMMEKVLNDVLDFNRMEAGKLLYASSPFDFGKVIRSVLLGLNVAATSKEVKLSSELDPRVEVLGELIGDEMRLRQVLSNLTSNACKFTNAGGSVTLKTKLVLPGIYPETPERPDEDATGTSSLDAERASSQSTAVDQTFPKHVVDASVPDHKVTIRVEVHDTGMGIRARDVRNDRLFSPYVQTEIGKRQGGKGTGLGLALVRNIVQLSGGRLGLQSKAGQGSIFWVEQGFELVNPALLQKVLRSSANTSTTSKSSTVLSKIEDITTVHVLEQPTVDSSRNVPHTQAAQGIVEIVQEDEEAPSSPPPPTKIVAQREMAETEHVERPSLVHLHSSEIEVVETGGSSSSNKGKSPKVDVSRPYSPGDEFVNFGGPQIMVPVDLDFNRPLQVLVVDDDLLTRRLMTRMITRLGHQVQSAENGALALDLLRKHDRDATLVPFDVVFLDNQMPVLSGVEMVTSARLEGLQTMVCGVTGNAMKEDQDEYIESGADYVLTKPVMEASVKTMLQYAKDRRQGTKDA